MGDPWSRLLSYIWPVRIWKGPGAHGHLEVVWEYGRLVVNSANANQSHGSLHRVWQQVFRDADISGRRPATALVLGFGAGSVAHILLDELRLAIRITGVDDDAEMLRIARDRFGFANRNEVSLQQADAFSFIAQHQGSYDLIVVDLFHDREVHSGVAAPQFAAAIRRLASPEGVVVVNTMAHDPTSAELSARVGRELRLQFTEVKERAYERENRVFIAL